MTKWMEQRFGCRERPGYSARKLRASRPGCNAGLGWGGPVDRWTVWLAIRYGKTGEKVQKGGCNGVGERIMSAAPFSGRSRFCKGKSRKTPGKTTV